MKLGHIGVPVSDVIKAKAFYSAIAPHVGFELLKDGDEWVGYGNDGSFEFFIHADKPSISNLHVCFEVDNREAVQAFYDAALAAGGTDHGAPGIRENYSPTYYAAFVLDPDGNNIEAVTRVQT